MCVCVWWEAGRSGVHVLFRFFAGSLLLAVEWLTTAFGVQCCLTTPYGCEP